MKMNKSTKSLLTTAALFVTLAGMAAMIGATAQASPSPLDGTKWSVKVTPDGEAAKKGEKTFDDTIVFIDGKVSMSECLKAGFGASSYTCEPKGSGMKFDTMQKSEKEGKDVWAGEVDGDSVKGTMVWTKKDGSVFHYTFEGKKAAK